MTPASTPLLIVCIGNPMRGDDGLGTRVARRLLALGIPRSAVRVAGELLPELAADLATAEDVVFVDAAVGDVPGALRVEPLAAGPGGPWTHHLTPASLLALTGVAYGHVPPATVVTVVGREFEMGRPLSPEVAARVADVAALIVARWPVASGPS